MLHLLAQIPLNAERLSTAHSGFFSSVFTNSIVVAGIVAIIVLVFARRATARMELVPSRGSQNIFEMVIEGLYDMLEGIVGRHMIARAFPLLATLFLFILASNWFGLLPGLAPSGSTRQAKVVEPRSLFPEIASPLLRPPNADLNLTLGMALVFTVYWAIWSFQELGVGGFFVHIFGPKGEVKGAIKYVLILIFGFVGIIEVVSIAFRPVSLSLRLFGNIYAGENLMHTMSGLGETMHMPGIVSLIMKVVIPIPFYFLELLVGIVQALVFTLLCAVYLKLTTSHEGGDLIMRAAIRAATATTKHRRRCLPDEQVLIDPHDTLSAGTIQRVWAAGKPAKTKKDKSYDDEHPPRARASYPCRR